MEIIAKGYFDKPKPIEPNYEHIARIDKLETELEALNNKLNRSLLKGVLK
jgi:hypothetical protein